MTTHYYIIKTNSSSIQYPYGEKQLTFKEVYPKIKADTIEIINLGPTMEMWVDENGLLTDKQYNSRATELVKMYGSIKPTPRILGDVAIVDIVKRD
jgi:hypothetical protein